MSNKFVLPRHQRFAVCFSEAAIESSVCVPGSMHSESGSSVRGCSLYTDTRSLVSQEISSPPSLECQAAHSITFERAAGHQHSFSNSLDNSEVSFCFQWSVHRLAGLSHLKSSCNFNMTDFFKRGKKKKKNFLSGCASRMRLGLAYKPFRNRCVAVGVRFIGSSAKCIRWCTDHWENLWIICFI